jgi:hypothetical protein
MLQVLETLHLILNCIYKKFKKGKKFALPEEDIGTLILFNT